MNLKKVFSLTALIGGMALCGESPIVHAMEYKQTWMNSWGGSSWDEVADIDQLKDGGFLVTVYDGDQESSFLVKYNSNFEEEWVNDYKPYELSIYNTEELKDGSLLLVGSSMYSFVDSTVKVDSSAFIIKTDANGTIEFATSFDGNDYEGFQKAFQVSDGGFVALGVSDSTNAGFSNKGGMDIVVVKYSSEGKQEWVKNFGGSSVDIINNAIQTKDGGWAIVGTSHSPDFGFQYAGDGSPDAILLKLDAEFNLQWIKGYGERNQDDFYDLVETESGELIVVGESSDDSTIDPVIVKYSANGDLLWDYRMKTGNFYNKLLTIIPNRKEGFLIAGILGDGLKVFELKSNQSVEPIISLNANDWVCVRALLQTSNGDLLVGGDTYATDFGFENQGETDAFLIKFSPKTDADIQINGTIQPMMADVTIPSVSPDLVIDPNSPDGAISPGFEITNDSTSPIKLELKTFEQTTHSFNDVLPDKYDSWEGLNKTQSQDLALGLIAKDGEGWQRLTTPTSYVSDHTEHELGVIKPTSQVNFEFDVHHGRAFSEAKTVQYRMVFVFDLLS